MLVGPHEPDGAAPCLRCVEMHKGAVVWESMAGDEGVRQLKDLRVVSHLVVFGQRTSLIALDLATGQQRYVVHLSDRLDAEASGEARGALVYETPGGLVAKTVGGSLLTFDPESGAVRARRVFAPRMQAVPTGTGAVVARYDVGGRNVLEVLDPQTLQPTAAFGKAWWSDEATVQRVHVFGATLVAYVDRWGLLGAKGVLVVDLPSRQKVLFEREQGLDEDMRPALGQSCVFYTSMDGVLHRAPTGASTPPMPGHRFAAVQAAGPTLLAAMVDGRGAARVVGLDAGTLQPRYDCGWVQPPSHHTPIPHRDPHRYFAVVQSVAFVVAMDGSADGELRAFDVPTGTLLWKRALTDVGALDDWHPLGNCLVMRSALGVLVLDASSGAMVAAYAPK